MKIVYQLHAKGRALYFDSITSIASKQVFTTKKAAEDFIPNFKDRCCNSESTDVRSLNDIDPNTINVTIAELELMDEE